MSHILQELYLKANEHVIRTTPSFFVNQAMITEKFAELIIQEAENFVASRYDETEPWMKPGELTEHFQLDKSWVDKT
jgi:hypothetical protein